MENKNSEYKDIKAKVIFDVTGLVKNNRSLEEIKKIIKGLILIDANWDFDFTEYLGVDEDDIQITIINY